MCLAVYLFGGAVDFFPDPDEMQDEEVSEDGAEGRVPPAVPLAGAHLTP